ncbi:hypothetical protein EV186_102903 [Labedaea rhizosphaerae]|uniref:Abortive infection protein n=2 Tax=Labedaea rhizosphaerae TaxID=598644 RepID=A0A4R6SI28_LABRH|nr:hypothetical protein EV186_102903 [Labedaea rhizosphaerae]
MTYDTGFVRHGDISRKHFDPGVVRRELTVIRDELHCNAVQLIGGDPERLEFAAGVAAELGLEVWFSPYPLELSPDEILELFADCAHRAERVRRTGAEVVFVAGVEMTLMNPGYLPGDHVGDRVARLLGAEQPRKVELITTSSRALNEFLGKAVAAIRERFGGKVTYCAVPLERVDWSVFDFVAVELIRSAAVADQFEQGVRTLVAQGKPVAITGFGSAAWKGAPDVAPTAMDIVENDENGVPLRLDGVYERDEDGQARYLREVLDVFDREGVDATFVFMFALENYPHRPGGDPRDDLDLASPSIVRVGEDGHSWEPKAAFHAVAASYLK